MYIYVFTKVSVKQLFNKLLDFDEFKVYSLKVTPLHRKILYKNLICKLSWSMNYARRARLSAKSKFLRLHQLIMIA